MLFLVHCCAYAVDIAITIDDFPSSDSRLFSAQKRTEAFLKACENHHCKAAFFCIGPNCTRPGGAALLALVNSQGMFLANHSMTHSHVSS